MRRDLRLASGLVLFTHVAAHLVNHTLELVSVAVADRGQMVTLALWHSVPGTVLLYGAAGVHLALAFNAIYNRRQRRCLSAPAAGEVHDAAHDDEQEQQPHKTDGLVLLQVSEQPFECVTEQIADAGDQRRPDHGAESVEHEKAAWAQRRSSR